MSSTVLVTGGAGFIGSSLVRNLLDTTQDTMIVLDKLTYAGNLDSLGRSLDDPRVSFVEGDIGDQALVSDLLQSNQVKQIYNLAAESHVDRSIDGPGAFVETAPGYAGYRRAMERKLFREINDVQVGGGALPSDPPG